MPLHNHWAADRRLSSYPHCVICGSHRSVEDAKRWATSNTKQECTYTGWPGKVTFYFDDPRDALMFKLAYG